MLGEVEGVTKDLVHWRHTVDLQERTCTCRRWQVTGIPCTHALCIITSIRGYNIEDFVHDYYSVAKFKKAYGKSVKPMTDKKQWPQVNPGFKLWPPILKRTAGRPRERRYKSAAEGGTGGTGQRTTRCKRCKQLGHMEKTCNEYVHESDVPPPALPKPKRKKAKQTITIVPSMSTDPLQEPHPFATPTRAITPVSASSSPVTRSVSRRLLQQEPSTPTIIPVQTPSPMTRSRKRMLELELEGSVQPVSCAALSPVAINEKGTAQTPSPMTRSRKRMLELELESSIQPVSCAALSPVAINEKGKAKKLKVVRSKKA